MLTPPLYVIPENKNKKFYSLLILFNSAHGEESQFKFLSLVILKKKENKAWPENFFVIEKFSGKKKKNIIMVDRIDSKRVKRERIYIANGNIKT